MTRETKDVWDKEKKVEECGRNDLSRGSKLLLLWGPPTLVSILASSLYRSGLLQFTPAAILWTTSTAWIGILCLANGIGCGRVHCLIDGSLLPLLSGAGILSLLGVIPFDWNYYGAFFWAIVITSFLVECLWNPYAFDRSKPRNKKGLTSNV